MSIKTRAENIQEFWKALVTAMVSKKEPFVGEIIEYIKTDEEFFNTFIKSIEKDKRYVIASAIRRVLIDSSKKISG